MFRSEKNMQIKCGTAHRPFPTELPKNSRTLKAVLNVKEEYPNKKRTNNRINFPQTNLFMQILILPYHKQPKEETTWK